MEYRKVFLLSVVVFLSACAGKNVEQPVTVEFEPVESEYPITIPFEAGVGVEREIKLSDIADSVQYVPLETNDKCLIDFINSGKVVKTGKYWFVSSNTRLYQYTTDGKFVRNIGSRGGGPGQFNYFQQIDVNEDTGLIFMLTTSGKINVYEMETGKFLYDIKIPDKETAQFAMLNDTLVATFMLNMQWATKRNVSISPAKKRYIEYLLSFLDLFEDKSGTRWLMMSGIDRYMFRYKDLICYKEFYNDTLFVVTEKELQPVISSI